MKERTYQSWRKNKITNKISNVKAVLKLLIIISIVFCFSVSCKKYKITEGVYVVGSEDLEVDDSKIIAKYWKNCSAVIL